MNRKIYTGIEFTHFHWGPAAVPPFVLSALNEHMLQISRGKRAKAARETGEEELASRHQRRKFQGLL